MNKVLITSALGIGGTGASLTGAYSLGFFDSLGTETINKYKPINFSSAYEEWSIHNDTSNFKQHDVPDCVKKMFPNISKIEDAPGYGQAQDVDANFSFEEGKNSQGCLVIYLNKEESEKTETPNKYTGDITFMWSFAQETKGFMAYSNLSFSQHGSEKALADGLFYALSQEESGKENWKINSKYEWSTKVELDNNSLPKVGNALGSLKDFSYWGLEGGNKNTSGLSKKVDLSDTKAKEGGSYWRWKGEGNNEVVKVGDWSSNLSDWWKKIFGTSKNKELPSKLENIKGVWEQISTKELQERSQA